MTIPQRLRAAALLVVISTCISMFAGAQTSDGERKVITKTPAVYPTLAKSMNIHGIVKLEALVLPNGTVKSVDIRGGHPILTQSAVSAVERWKFEPASHETKELIQIQFEQ